MSDKRPLIDTAAGIQSPVVKELYSLVQPWVEGVLGINRLHKRYNRIKHLEDPVEFAKGTLDAMGIRYTVPVKQLAEFKKIEGPLVVVANHPFGGPEALIIIAVMSEIRNDFKVMANFMFQKVHQLQNHLILVDPFGTSESKTKNLSGIRASFSYLKHGGMMGIFPAGEVATYNPKSGKVEEPQWNPNIAALIRKTGATVVPLFFHGYNSTLFHLVALMSPKLRTMLLVREFVKNRKDEVRFDVGSPISPSRINQYEKPEELIAYLRSKTYVLGTRVPKQSSISLDLVEAVKITSDHQTVIDPVSVDVLTEEINQLPSDALLYSAKDMDVFIFQKPYGEHIIDELGRLREVTYRGVGEGTGKAKDVDEFDDWYHHLIIWNKEKKEIVGSYRLCHCDSIIQTMGQKGLYNNATFHIQPELYQQINPALELGRSFVRKEYQKSYWSLLLLWTGIGHYIVRHPQYHSLIGSVSISADFNSVSKDIMVMFLLANNLAKDLRKFVTPRNPYNAKSTKVADYYNSFSVKNLNDVQELISEIESSDLKVPILIKHYLKMGGQIIAFNVDEDFSNVLDGLMYIDLRQTKPDMLKRYMGAAGYELYAKEHGLLTERTMPTDLHGGQQED